MAVYQALVDAGTDEKQLFTSPGLSRNFGLEGCPLALASYNYSLMENGKKAMRYGYAQHCIYYVFALITSYHPMIIDWPCSYLTLAWKKQNLFFLLRRTNTASQHKLLF